MIHLLNNGKVLLQVDDEYYEFIRQNVLAKNGGLIPRCKAYDVNKLIDDDVLYKLEDKYVYINTETDNIYIWTDKDHNNNVSDKIIWYLWNNNTFDKITDDKYDNIINEYNNNKLRKLKEFYESYNSTPVSDKEPYTTSTEEEDDDSDFILDDDDEDVSEDESIPIDEEIENTSALVNNYINYMTNNMVEFRTEYVNNLIHVANSTSDLETDRFLIVLDNLHKYYLI